MDYRYFVSGNKVMCQKVMKIQNGRGFITEKGEPATLIKEFSTQEEAVKALEYLRKNKDK